MLIRKSLFIVLLVVISLTNLFAQEARIIIDQQSGPNPWNHLDVFNADKNFQFAIVTDRTGGHRAGVFPSALQKLNLLMPEFVVSVGDLIEGYTEDDDELKRQWDEFEGFVDQLKVPFFYVPGNHDITNKKMSELWLKKFGRHYYSFKYQDVLFLCLNSEDEYRGAGKGSIEEEQYKWIEKTLADNQDVRWTLVFMHQPLWNQKDPKKWPDVEKLLAERQHTVFVGHQHNYVKYERNNGKYFILATTGGGSSLRGPLYGEFDHVVWVTMTDDGPILANLMLDGIWDENVRTEELGNLVSKITSVPVASVQPITKDDLEAEKLAYDIRLKNVSEGPMHYTLHIQNVMGADSLIDGVIEPNNTALKSVVAASSSNDVVIRATYNYEMGAYPTITTNQFFRLRPIETYKPSEKKFTVKLDGKIDEWPKLRFQNNELKSAPFHHNGDKDGSFKWDIKIQDSLAYVAVEVIDNELFTPKVTGHLEQDAIAILIDPSPMVYSSQNVAARDQVFKSWFPLLVTPNKDVVTDLAYPSIVGEMFKVNCRRTQEGYQAEFMIPIQKLQQKGSDGTFRINVFMNDFDQKGEHQSMLQWQHAWDSEMNVIGSGTFKLKK